MWMVDRRRTDMQDRKCEMLLNRALENKTSKKIKILFGGGVSLELKRLNGCALLNGFR